MLKKPSIIKKHAASERKKKWFIFFFIIGIVFVWSIWEKRAFVSKNKAGKQNSEEVKKLKCHSSHRNFKYYRSKSPNQYDFPLSFSDIEKDDTESALGKRKINEKLRLKIAEVQSKYERLKKEKKKENFSPPLSAVGKEKKNTSEPVEKILASMQTRVNVDISAKEFNKEEKDDTDDQPVAEDDWIRIFDEHDLAYKGGRGLSESDNRQGDLAWGESYIMMSYLAMYRGTGNLKYLDKLIAHAIKVQGQRDNQHDRQDFRGISGPAWLSERYSKEPVAWLVHSGMITFPMADFAQTVVNNRDLWDYQTDSGETYIEVAEKLVDEIGETINFHEHQWNSKLESYRFQDLPGYNMTNIPLPINHNAAMGRTMLMMYLATKDLKYLTRTSDITNNFRQQLIYFQDLFVWPYWNKGGAAEDISHGAIEVNFAWLCYKYQNQTGRLLFSRRDMERFSATFTENIFLGPKLFAMRVNGTGTASRSYTIQTGRWLNLAIIKSDIYYLIADYFLEDMQKLQGGPTSFFLAIANLQLIKNHLENKLETSDQY